MSNDTHTNTHTPTETTSIVPRMSKEDASLALSLAQDDWTKASDELKARAIVARCQALGVDVRTAPFIFIRTNGGTKLYATAACIEQIAKRNSVTVVVTKRYETSAGLYVIEGYAETPDGRRTTDIAVIPLQGLRGEHLANAMMKAETKFHRRVVKKHCGLGSLPDAEEMMVEGGAFQEANPRGKYWNLHSTLGLPHHESDENKALNYQAWSAILGRPVETGSDLSDAEWAALLDYLERGAMGDASAPLHVGGWEGLDLNTAITVEARVVAEGEGESAPEPDSRPLSEAEVMKQAAMPRIMEAWECSAVDAKEIADMMMAGFGVQRFEAELDKVLSRKPPVGNNPAWWLRGKLKAAGRLHTEQKGYASEAVDPFAEPKELDFGDEGEVNE